MVVGDLLALICADELFVKFCSWVPSLPSEPCPIPEFFSGKHSEGCFSDLSKSLYPKTEAREFYIVDTDDLEWT